MGCPVRAVVDRSAAAITLTGATTEETSITGTEPITGAEFFARSLAANGTTHVPFIDAVPRRTLIEPGTLGVTRVLGHSEKAALGAKCAATHRKVICWSGDGAIYCHLTELETAKRRGIAIVLVINDNSGFGQGWANIQPQQCNKPGDVRDLVRLGPTNFADVARVFGLRGIRVEDPSQLQSALKEALASDETVIVDVATDIDCRAPAPWLPEA